MQQHQPLAKRNSATHALIFVPAIGPGDRPGRFGNVAASGIGNIIAVARDQGVGVAGRKKKPAQLRLMEKVM